MIKIVQRAIVQKLQMIDNRILSIQSAAWSLMTFMNQIRRSGTRIPLVASGRGAISLEEYVANPRAYNQDFMKFADLQRLDTSRFRLLSILSPKVRRNSTSKTGLGGRTMTQLFRWEEPYVKCPTWEGWRYRIINSMNSIPQTEGG